MRVTETVIGVYDVLRDGGWHSASDVAARLGSNRQHLNYVLNKLHEERFLRVNRAHPRQYTLVAGPMREQLATQCELARALMKRKKA